MKRNAGEIELRFEKLNETIGQFSSIVDQKVSIIEDACTKIFQIEEQQDRFRLKVNELISIQTDGLKDVKAAARNLEKVVKSDIELITYRMKKKMNEYDEFRSQLNSLLKQADLLFNSDNESEVLGSSKQNEDCVRDPNVDSDLERLVSDASSELDRLKEENTMLTDVANEQKKVIDQLVEERGILVEYSEQEIEKWKHLSFLSVPLIQLLDIRMRSNQEHPETPQANVNEIENSSPSVHQTSQVDVVANALVDPRETQVTESLVLEPDTGRNNEIPNDIVIEHLAISKSNELLEQKEPSEADIQPEAKILTEDNSSTIQHSSSELTILSREIFNDIGHPIATSTQMKEIKDLFTPYSQLQRSNIGCKEKDHVDGFGKRACFNTPLSLHIIKNNIYVSEIGNKAIRKVNISDGLVSTVTNPIEPHLKFKCPGSLCATRDGLTLFITDLFSHHIFEVDVTSGSVKHSFTKVIAHLGKIRHPSHVLVDEEDFVYISHSQGILRVPLSFASLTRNSGTTIQSRSITYVGNPKRRGYKDGSFDECLFDHPNGMTFLSQNILLVCDSRNNVLRIVDFERRVVETFCGNGKSGCVDKSIFECSFCLPKKVCYNMEKNRLYLTESSHGNIRVIDLDAEKVSTLVITPPLISPYDIACMKLSDSETLFVVDSDAHCIERIVLT